MEIVGIVERRIKLDYNHLVPSMLLTGITFGEVPRADHH